MGLSGKHQTSIVQILDFLSLPELLQMLKVLKISLLDPADWVTV